MKFIETWFYPTFQALYERFIAIVPNILAAAAMLLAGWITALGLQRLVTRFLKRVNFDSLAKKAGFNAFLGKAGFQHAPSILIGTMIFWLTMLIFLLSAADVLNLTLFAEVVQKLVAFIPNLIAVVFIVLFGSLFGRFVGQVVQGAAEEAQLEAAEVLGKLISNIITFLIAVIAFKQLDIESSALELTFAIMIGAAGLALALTFGLGMRNVAQNIISGVYVRKMFHPGQVIAFQDKHGEILQIGPVSTTVQNARSVIYVPNKILIDEVSESQTAPE